MSQPGTRTPCPICGKPISNLKLHRGMDANCVAAIKPGDVVTVRGVYPDNASVEVRALVVGRHKTKPGFLRVRLQRTGSETWLCRATDDGYVKTPINVTAEQIVAVETRATEAT